MLVYRAIVFTFFACVDQSHGSAACLNCGLSEALYLDMVLKYASGFYLVSKSYAISACVLFLSVLSWVMIIKFQAIATSASVS